MNVFGARAGLEDDQVAVDDDDGIGRGIQNGPRRLATLREVRLGGDVVRDIARDEHRLSKLTIGALECAAARLHHHPVTVSVLSSESNPQHIVAVLVERLFEHGLHARAVVGMDEAEDAGPVRDFVREPEEVLTLRAVVRNHHVTVDDHDQVGRRGEYGLGHFDDLGQLSDVVVARGHVAAGGVDQIASTLRPPLDPSIGAVAGANAILEASAQSVGANPLGLGFDECLFYVVGVHQIDELLTHQRVDVPPEKLLPRRIEKSEPSPRSVHRKEVSGVPEVLGQVRRRPGTGSTACRGGAGSSAIAVATTTQFWPHTQTYCSRFSIWRFTSALGDGAEGAGNEKTDPRGGSVFSIRSGARSETIDSWCSARPSNCWPTC